MLIEFQTGKAKRFDSRFCSLSELADEIFQKKERLLVELCLRVLYKLYDTIVEPKWHEFTIINLLSKIFSLILQEFGQDILLRT